MLLYQIGQCGNQIGLELWSELLKMPIAPRGHSAESAQTVSSTKGGPLIHQEYGVNASDWHLVSTPYPSHDAWYSLRRLFIHDDGSARGIVVDSEPKVIEHVEATLASIAASTGVRNGKLFRSDSLIAEQCGRGNNWALGYYGGGISRLSGWNSPRKCLGSINADSDSDETSEEDASSEAEDAEEHLNNLLSPVDFTVPGKDEILEQPSIASKLEGRRRRREENRVANYIRKSKQREQRVWKNGRPKSGVYGVRHSQSEELSKRDTLVRQSSPPLHSIQRPQFTLDTNSDESSQVAPDVRAGPGQSRIGLYKELEDARSLSSRSLEATRRHLERMDYLTGICFTHALSGGTGSGLGSRLTEETRDMIGAKPLMIHVAISPFRVGEIALQHYNCALTMSTLHECSDAIWLASNDDIFTALSLGLQSSQQQQQQGSVTQSMGLLSPFASANRYISSSLLDFLSPTFMHKGVGSNMTNAWSDPSLQLTSSLADVCPVPGAKLIELWNSSGLVFNSPTPTIPIVATDVQSNIQPNSSGSVMFNGSWAHHFSMLTRCVPKSIPWSGGEHGACAYASPLPLLEEAKKDACGSALPSLRSELTFPIEGLSDEVPSLSEYMRASSSPYSGDATIFQKTLCAKAAFHGCKIPGRGAVSDYVLDYRSQNKNASRDNHLEAVDLDRAFVTLTRLFPTPNWINSSDACSIGGVKGILSCASSISSFVALTGPAVFNAIQQQEQILANRGESRGFGPLTGKSLMSAQSTASGAIRRRLAKTSLDTGQQSATPSEVLGRSVSLALNRGRSAQSLMQCATRCTEMLNARAYLHWFERCGSSATDIAEATEVVNQIIDNYRVLLR